MSKLERLGFLSGHVCFEQICDDQDTQFILANQIQWAPVVLHLLLPPVKNIPYSLRPKPHDRELPVAGTIMRNDL